jgi:hypothetical protein
MEQLCSLLLHVNLGFAVLVIWTLQTGFRNKNRYMLLKVFISTAIPYKKDS